MKKCLSLILSFSMLSAPAVGVCAEEKCEFYVDAKAVEGGNGSIDSPFSSIAEAQEAVRALKKNGTYPKGGVTVTIRGGNYTVADAITFGKEDSGENGAPVVYRAYPLEEVNIVGGTELKLGDCKISDSSAIPSSAKGKVYSYNLRDNNIAAYDKLYVTGHSIWALSENWPEISLEPLSTPEVFYNDEVTTVARYPNGDEYLRVGAVKNDGYLRDKNNVPPLKDAPTMIFGVNVSQERLENWSRESDGWMFGYWRYDWSDQTTPIKKVNTSDMTVESEYPSGFGCVEGQRFYVYNMMCELDSPGEWFYDKNTGEFYIYPKDNNPESRILLGFSSNNLIKMQNCSNIEIRDLNFAGTRSSGISVLDSENIKLFGNTVKNVSGNGINVYTSKNITIDSSHIYNVGGRGIAAECGNEQTLEPGNVLVINNWIHNFGRLNKTYYGALTISGCGNTARFNTFYDGPHLAIQFSGLEQTIEYNDISNVLKEAADMGACYTGRSLVKRGTVLRGNIIHDINSNSDHSGQYGIYLDDVQSGVSVVQNLFYNIDGSGVFVNGGRDNSVTDNVFVNNKSSSILVSAIGVGYGIGYLPNLGIPDISNYKPNEAYMKFPHLAELAEDDNPVAPKYNVVKDNVSCKVGKIIDLQPMSTGVTVAMMKNWSEYDDGITVGMNVFEDPDNENYKIAADLSKKLPGFETVDYNKAGLITSRLKNTLSDDAVVLSVGKPCAYVNWNKKLIDENNIDITPKIKDNLTYVPIRFLGEMLGADVDYNDGKIVIEYNGKKLELEKDSDKAVIDGAEITLPGACFIENSRTLVPLRSISDLFGKKVFWDDSGVIVISSKDMEDLLDEDMIQNLSDRL